MLQILKVEYVLNVRYVCTVIILQLQVYNKWTKLLVFFVVTNKNLSPWNIQSS